MSGREMQPRGASAADRRRARRPVSMQGQMIRGGGITHVIEVTDLNYGGCGLRTPVALATGESVQVSIFGRGSIAAQVRWYNDGKAGLVFEPIPNEAQKKIERRAARLEVPGDVGLRARGQPHYRVRILDLSTDGCRVEMVERPAVGDAMLVKFEGLEVIEAHVAWVVGNSAGLKFERPIHPAVLDLLAKRLAGRETDQPR